MALASTNHEWLAFATPIAVIIAAIFQKLDARRVRSTLTKETTKHNSKLDEIHNLVNGGMTDQKRIAMLQARRIADLTRDPKDVQLAEESQRVYEEHIFRMVRVDTALAKKKAGGNPPP